MSKTWERRQGVNYISIPGIYIVCNDDFIDLMAHKGYIPEPPKDIEIDCEVVDENDT